MKTRKRDTRWLVLLALFVAIEIFLNVTGIGLIPLPLIKASTLHIPVIIGAVLMGPLAGGILGGVFGLCSIWSNSTAPGLLSFAFSPFLATSAAGAVKTIWIAFGCRVLGYKRHLTGQEPDCIEFVPLDQLLEQSDIVSLHCPLNDESKHLIDKDAIARMKDGAYLINTARGPVVDSQAVADALNSGKLAGAGIDVFEQEPPLDTAHPLLHARNTIVTPHVAFASAESMVARARIVFDNIDAFLTGEQRNIVL